MDWIKLISLSAVLFMLLEIVSAKIIKFKTWVTRVIIFTVMAGACFGLALAAPVIIIKSGMTILNTIIYFVAEYFLFLFLRNELNFSLKQFILNKFQSYPAPPAPTPPAAARVQTNIEGKK